jgi:hypothetical protein
MKKINPKEEQKLPYDIIEFVRKLCYFKHDMGIPLYGDITWNGNSDDVKTIRKMMREVYGK